MLSEVYIAVSDCINIHHAYLIGSSIQSITIPL